MRARNGTDTRVAANGCRVDGLGVAEVSAGGWKALCPIELLTLTHGQGEDHEGATPKAERGKPVGREGEGAGAVVSGPTFQQRRS